MTSLSNTQILVSILSGIRLHENFPLYCCSAFKVIWFFIVYRFPSSSVSVLPRNDSFDWTAGEQACCSNT